MGKVIVNIILSALILVSSTGIQMYGHYCTKSNMSLKSLLIPVSCEHDKNEENNCASGSCESHSSAHHNIIEKTKCCVDYTQFIKVDQTFTETVKVTISGTVFFLIKIVFLTTDNQLNTNTSFFHSLNPIPHLYNKGILFSVCTLLL